jgi:hypothetical protein
MQIVQGNLQLGRDNQSQWEDLCCKLSEYEAISSQPKGTKAKNSFIYQAQLSMYGAWLRKLVNFCIFKHWMTYLAH